MCFTHSITWSPLHIYYIMYRYFIYAYTDIYKHAHIYTYMYICSTETAGRKYAQILSDFLLISKLLFFVVNL